MSPPSEAPNELTLGLDALDAAGFVRALRSCDAQLFAGWRSHPGLLDTPLLESAERFVLAAAEVLSRQDGLLVLTGCGASPPPHLIPAAPRHHTTAPLSLSQAPLGASRISRLCATSACWAPARLATSSAAATRRWFSPTSFQRMMLPKALQR